MGNTSEHSTPKLDGTGLAQVWSNIVELFATKKSVKDVYTKEEADSVIQTAVKSAIAGVYKVKGSVAFADLPTEDVKEGYVYNIMDNFTTTSNFVEGAGKEYGAGTNVVYTENGWDCMAGIFDFSDFMMKSDIRSISAEEIQEICVLPDDVQA